MNMPNPQTLPVSKVLPHPNFNSKTKRERAAEIHKYLVSLARDESEKDLRSIYQRTADFFKDEFFGKSEAKIRTAITRSLEDYFDGDDYIPVELENIAELTQIKKKVLLPVIEKMVNTGEIAEGRRRRHLEAGTHYTPVYRLAK